jgi:hypothetical protein
MAEGGPVARMRVTNRGHGNEIECAHGRPDTGEETPA